jgi:phosphatidate cytidylyltransferase
MKTTLKKRIITASVLVPLVLLALLYAHEYVLLGLLMGVLTAAEQEWENLIPLSAPRYHALFLIGFFACLFCCLVWFAVSLTVGLVLWCLVILAILTYPASQRVWGFPWVVGAVGCVFIPLAGVSAIGLYQQEHGAWLVIYVLALVVVADSGAYFVGKLWGKHPLIPRVSSGKTIEGALGGLLLPLGVAWGAGLVWSPYSWPLWFALALGTAVISMFGDLSISMLKRRCHVKDTGSLLPGHGGVLDRLDSVLAALPWFYIGFYYFFPEL